MGAHVQVTAALLLDFWAAGEPNVRTQSASRTVVEKLLYLRTQDWAQWLALLIAYIRGNRDLLRYTGTWMVGHFLPIAPVDEAL